jgi:hypothetical protein
MTNTAMTQQVPQLISEPPVWLTIGNADRPVTQQLRQVLQATAARGGADIVVDLAGLEDRADEPVFSLLVETLIQMLVEASEMATTQGRVLTVLHPPLHLGDRLLACGVRVVSLGAAPPKPPGTFTINIGGARTTTDG